MSLAIVTHQAQLASDLLKTLQHYFPSQGSVLNIQTKYYSCNVPVKIYSPSDILMLNQDHKIDLLIFLFHSQEVIEGINNLIDKTIGRFTPQSQIVIVNTAGESDEEWKYQDALIESENFVSVVYEDLKKMAEMLPAWKKGGLLNEEEEQFQLFSLFQLIQTTIWSNSLKKDQQKHGKKEHTDRMQEQIQKLTNPQKKQDRAAESDKEKNLNGQGQMAMNNEHDQEDNEENEEKLQKEMMEFEMLMQQMMSIKGSSLKGNQRKVRAEELIMKLTGNMNLL